MRPHAPFGKLRELCGKPFGIPALRELFPELAAGIFAPAFERSHNFFRERRVLRDSLAHKDSREPEVACIRGIARAQYARFKNRLRRKFATHCCRNQRVGMERRQVARVHACDNRLRGICPERLQNNIQLPEVVLLADLDKRLYPEALGTLRHFNKLSVIQDSCNQEHRISTATVRDIDFVFVEQEILAQNSAGVQSLLRTFFHRIGDRNQVAERSLEKIAFGQHRNRLCVCIRIRAGKPNRVKVRSDVALRGRCTLDFENGTRRPEELDVPAASLLRNLYSEIQAQPLDILAAHPYDF